MREYDEQEPPEHKPLTTRARDLAQSLSDITNRALAKEIRRWALEQLLERLPPDWTEADALALAARCRLDVGKKGSFRRWLQVAGWLDAEGKEYLPATRLVSERELPALGLAREWPQDAQNRP